MSDFNTDRESLDFFVHLAATRSLSLAATKSGLSLSSASRKIAQMRTAFGDELFVRTGRGLVPTARAQELLPLVLDTIERMDRLFRSTQVDPSEFTGPVRIGGIDNAFHQFFRLAVGAIFQAAPNLKISTHSVIYPDFFEELRQDRLDLVIYPVFEKNLPDDFRSLLLAEQNFVYALRRNHPLAILWRQQGSVPLEAFSRYRHVVARAINRKGSDIVEKINAHSPETIAVETQNIMIGLSIVMNTDFLMMVPKASVEMLGKSMQLEWIPRLDGPLQKPVRLIWHRSKDHEPCIQWLRSVIASNVRNSQNDLA